MTTEIIELTKENSPATSRTEQLALDVLMGFTSHPKYIPPIHFYDAKGSQIFQKIMSAKDYYLTECELEIIKTHGKSMISGFDKNQKLQVIELGAGDGYKTKHLIEAVLDSNIDTTYYPIDISKQALEDLSERFSKFFPDLDIQCLQGEYFQSLKWLRAQPTCQRLVLFLGSNIGNFRRPQAEVFLKTLWNVLQDGNYVLIGADLKKDIDKMLWAYNDREGYTKDFNINLLSRINRELGANIDTSKFQHYGTYNVKLGAMESFLVSLEKQSVQVDALNRKFEFKAFEAIHVESSYKYLCSEMKEMANHAGFSLQNVYYDSKKYFADFFLKVHKKI